MSNNNSTSTSTSSSNREKEVIKLVMRQTDYTEEQAKEKLAQWNNNYINVIKEYLNPNFNKTKKEAKSKTLNQQMLGEIRTFMDDVYIKFENRKRYNQYINVLNSRLNAEMQQKQKEEKEKRNGGDKEKKEETEEDNETNQIKIEEVV